MFKKSVFFTFFILISNIVLADTKVIVKNNSKHDVFLIDKELQVSDYKPDPLSTIESYSSDTFFVYSYYSSEFIITELEYNYDEDGYSPGCYFKFVIMKDLRFDKLIPQRIVAESKRWSPRDRAKCSGTLDDFDMKTGNATITLSINRIKF